MARIFICHAFEDFHLATQLKLNFKPHEKYEILQTDYEHLDDVDQHEKIIEKIQSCDLFILVWTQNAELAPEVMFEWTNALNLHVDFLVCQFDDTQLPTVLRKSKIIPFVSFKKGMTQLKKHVGANNTNATDTVETTAKTPEKRSESSDSLQKPDEDTTNLVEGPIFVGTAHSPKSVEEDTVTDAPEEDEIPEAKHSPPQPEVATETPEPTSWEKSYRQASAPGRKPKSGYRLEIIIPAAILVILTFLVALILFKRGKNTKIYRTTPTTISEQAVRQMVIGYDFYALDWNDNSKGYPNEFIIEEVNGDKIIHDENSGLVWQQGGSEQPIESYKAEVYVAKLNQINFGGYSDWRLPTLEEAMTLMEPYLNPQELHIDPIFKGLWCIWTADRDEFGQRWAVNFYNRPRTDFTEDVYVRACR